MKLSEAILQGSQNTTQCFHQLFERSEGGETIVAACALGAAALVAFGPNDAARHELDEIVAAFDADDHSILTCPVPDCDYAWDPHSKRYGPYRTLLRTIITHLNDDHHWKRQTIAHWVEGFGY